MEAEAALGEEGGEVLTGSQEKVGDGEREGDRLLVGLLTGLCFGDRACNIRLLLSWNICFWREIREKASVSRLTAQRHGKERQEGEPPTRLHPHVDVYSSPCGPRLSLGRSC